MIIDLTDPFLLNHIRGRLSAYMIPEHRKDLTKCLLEAEWHPLANCAACTVPLQHANGGLGLIIAANRGFEYVFGWNGRVVVHYTDDKIMVHIGDRDTREITVADNGIINVQRILI